MTKKYEKNEHGQYPTTIVSEIRVLEKRKGA
jgi:molybdenum cofactor biosynthesis enzyme